jgi:hypothetical protein
MRTFLRPSSPWYTSRSVSDQNAVDSAVACAPNPKLPTMPRQVSSTTKSGVGTALVHFW